MKNITCQKTKKTLTLKWQIKSFLAENIGSILNFIFPFDGPLVLNYHGILDVNSQLDYETANYVYFDKFKEQINFLEEQNYKFLSLEEFLEKYKTRKLTKKDCLITIDDIPLSFLPGAHYLIGKKIPFSFFVCTSYSDSPNKGKWMSWEILKELEKSKYVSFASHADRHLPFVKLSSAEIKNEIRNSFSKLNQHLSNVYNCIALPYGNYNGKVLSTIRDLSVDLIFLTDAKLSKNAKIRYKVITRVPIGAFDNLDTFKIKISGAYRFF
ncbi:polysaccharide deacetylase family protein [Patescibacteria group bacterium]|nr:polysaccharide deacetylase family protein [Patescibacteria group bacterium]